MEHFEKRLYLALGWLMTFAADAAKATHETLTNNSFDGAGNEEWLDTHVEKTRQGSCGYKGRIGIYEVLGNSIAIQKLIMAGATSQQIQDQAIEEDMVTMQSDGLVKMLRGNTSLEEVMRVTKE